MLAEILGLHPKISFHEFHNIRCVMVFSVKFIYSEKATKFCKISTIDLSYVVTFKFTVEISQTFVTFTEYMNFKDGRAKKIRDRTIVSLIKSTFGDQLFVDLRALYKLCVWNCFCSDLLNNFMLTNLAKHVKQDLVFLNSGWIEEIIYRSWKFIRQVQLNKILMQKCSVVWDFLYLFGWECLR